MFSNSLKNKIIQKYNISESLINRPIHYRIPDLVNLKMNPHPIYYSSKKFHSSKEKEIQKINILSTQINISKTNIKKNKIKKKLNLILKEENPLNNDLYKNFSKSLKMIYEKKKYSNFTSKTVIKDIINKKNHKKSTIFPKVYKNMQKNQKLTDINNKLHLNYFFTPQATKLKLNKKFYLRNIIEFPLKKNELNNNFEKDITNRENSIDYDKYSIKVIKTNTNNNQLSIGKFINDEYKKNNDNKNYSYYDSPIRISSRYFSNNIIKENND